MLARIQYTPEICVLLRLLIKYYYVPFHLTHIDLLQHSILINLSCTITRERYLGYVRSELVDSIPRPDD
jgi:hypothetical protein